MARLPTPGGDNGNWGDILNEYLSQSLKPDGTIKDNAVAAAQILDGSITEAQLDGNVQTKLNAVAGTPDWNTITNKPAVIASGADPAAARNAIGAGTSDLTIGTTSTTAKAGDYVPTKTEVGLGNVDNTSDAEKPLSTAAVTALSGKIDASALTAKGDIYVATSNSTVTRLGVGSDGQVLMADPSLLTGVKWSNIPGGNGNPGYSTNVGNGTIGPYTITHNLGTKDVTVSVYRNSGSYDQIIVQIERPTVNTIVLKPDEVWSTNQYRVVVAFTTQSDVTAPTAPTLSVDSVGTTNVQVVASGATDNIAVTGYNWYLNGSKVNASPTVGDTYNHTGLTSDTEYTFNATAVDLADNESALSNSVVQSTNPAGTVLRTALGGGNRVTSGNTVSWTHTVPSSNNRIIIVAVADTHASHFFGNTYDTYTVSSSIDGQFTQIDYQDLGPFSAQKLGTVRLFYKMDPSVGAHTITATVAESGQTFTQIMGNSASYSGVSGIGAPVSATTTTGAALNTSVTSGTGNMVVAAHAFSASPTGYNQTTLYSNGASVSGDTDYLLFGEANGSTTTSFTTSSANHRYASVAVNLVKAG